MCVLRKVYLSLFAFRRLERAEEAIQDADVALAKNSLSARAFMAKAEAMYTMGRWGQNYSEGEILKINF